MAELWVKGGKLWLRSSWGDLNRVHRVTGGRWHPKKKLWSWPATVGFWLRIKQQFPILQTENCEGLDEALERRIEAVKQKPRMHELLGVWPWKTTLRRHQVGAERFAFYTDAGLLDCHMGAGKTKVVLDIIYLRNHQRALVVCPHGVIPVWKHEEGKHSPVPLRVLTLTGSVAKRAKALSGELRHKHRPLMVVVNYEAVWREPLASVVLDSNWDLVVFDESHRIKAPGGKASRFCARIPASHRLALTGTPMAHSPLDLYAQYRALDPGIFGGSFQTFRDFYAVMGGFEGRQVVDYRNLDVLRERMDTIRWEVKEDALDLPPVQIIQRKCDLEPKAWQIYNSMQNDFEVEVKDGTVTASIALVKLLRLQQITSGHLKIEETGEIVSVSRAKEALFRELIEDMGAAPLVVFCRFLNDLKQARHLLEAVRGQAHRIGEISGSYKDYDRWQNGSIDAVVVQCQAGSLGIDLSRARYGIFFSLGFSLGQYEQMVARLHRPGQKGATVFYQLIARDTVDEKVVEALAARREVVQYILEGIK